MAFTEINLLSADLNEGKVRLNCTASRAGCMVLYGFRSIFFPHTSCDRASEAGRANRQDINLADSQDMSIPVCPAVG